MNTTSTHDTKRGEDVRARINVLSEIPEEWEERLRRWSGRNAGRKRVVNGIAAPDPVEEVLLYQTLLGAWPLEEEALPELEGRIQDYMVKALREAKVNTRWIRPNLPHENAVRDFISSLLKDSSPDDGGFLADFLPFQGKIAHYGAINGLAQVVVKIAAPGVPDIYQGTELWDLSLVDPDNRRPVDFRKRVALLDDLLARERQGRAALAGELLSSWKDGRIKLYLTCKALSLRREREELFGDGAYLPLPVVGKHREHALAFGRGKGDAWAIAAVPRLSTRLSPEGGFPVGQEAWGAKTFIRLPEGLPDRWRDAFTGEILQAAGTGGERTLPLQDVFRILPVALLGSV